MKCRSNCGMQSIKLFFTLWKQGVMENDHTHLESPEIYASPDGYLDLTNEVRMFCSILDNPDIKFVLQLHMPADKLCDVCFKEKVDATKPS